MTTPRLSLAAAGLGRRFVRMAKRLAIALMTAFGLYVLIVIVGLIPVNNSFQPTSDGIEIFIVSSDVHADLVLPIKTGEMNWRTKFPATCFAGDTTTATHVAIGWGDKGFFLETPTWADLKLSTTAKALFWPTDSCLHVSLTYAPLVNEDVRSVRISAAQYASLIAAIESSFRFGPSQELVQIPDAAYGMNDGFFESHGSYHCLNTCNSWVGSVIRQAGIRAAWLTPLPKTVFMYLPRASD